MREVGRQVLSEQGCFSRVRIWYAGYIPIFNGRFTKGWQGEPQTFVTRDIIRPIRTFVVERKP